MASMEKEVVEHDQKEAQWWKREEELVHREVALKEVKIQLQRGCVEVYEEGFMKAMRQALLFSPDLELTRFDIDKEVVDSHLVDD